MSCLLILLKSFQKSGLSEWLGKGMSGLSSLPPSAILVIMWLFTTCSTEIMSNSTITAVTLPIVTQMVDSLLSYSFVCFCFAFFHTSGFHSLHVNVQKDTNKIECIMNYLVRYKKTAHLNVSISELIVT